MSFRKPYSGPHRKLVLAFDVGTTFSGISYSVLDPGHIPEIKGVNRFPAQEHVGGDSKIPSILYYDQNGVVQAVGAEAMQPTIIEKAEDQEWIKVEWFKLHLRRKTLSSPYLRGHHIPVLPVNKSIIDVFADFFQYLHGCSKTYIQETHPRGSDLWKSFDNRIIYVLSHPNASVNRQFPCPALSSRGKTGQVSKRCEVARQQAMSKITNKSHQRLATFRLKRSAR